MNLKHLVISFFQLTFKVFILFTAMWVGYYIKTYSLVMENTFSVDGDPKTSISLNVLGDADISKSAEFDIPPQPIPNEKNTRDWLSVKGMKESTVSSGLSENLLPLVPHQSETIKIYPTATPMPTPIPEEKRLDAWWSVMEYNGRLVASINSTSKIGCEFQLTIISEQPSVSRKVFPLKDESCNFEVVIKDGYYKLWGKAISADGKIRTFGNL